MKNEILLVAISLMLSGCLGYSSRNNELIGQVKKVKHQTPLICPDRIDVDLSLGILRNGVGSMSSEDRWLTVENPVFVKLLESASEKGSLVKIKYDERRLTICAWEDIVNSVEIVP